MGYIVFNYGLFFVFISMHFLNKDYFLIPITNSFNITPISLCMFFIGFYIISFKKLYFHKNLLLFLCMFALGELAYFFAFRYIDSIVVLKYTVFQILQILMLIIIYSLLFYTKNIGEQLKKSLVIILILDMVLYLFQLPITLGSRNESLLGIFYGFDGIPRLQGYFGDPNYFSLCLTMHFFLTVMYKKINLKNKVIIILYFFNIILALSRGAILANCFILIMLTFYNWKKINVKNLITFFLVILSIIIVIILFYNTDQGKFFYNILFMQDSLVNKFDFENEGSFQERFQLLVLGVQASMEYPFGAGIGQQMNIIKEFYGVEKVTHNDFVGVLIEYGIMGLTIYLYIFYNTYKKSSFVAKVILIGFMLNLFTLSCFPYLMIISLTLGLLMYHKEEKDYIEYEKKDLY